MRKLLVTASAVLLAAAMAQPAQAQVQFGAEAAFGDATDFGVGVRAQTPIGGMFGEGMENLRGAADAIFYFWNCDPFNCSYFEVNANGHYPIEIEDVDFEPYVGGGLNVAFTEFGTASDTDIGINLVGGADFELNGFDTFAEIRRNIGGGGQFSLVVGILLGSGG